MLDSARRDHYRRARTLFARNRLAEALDLLDEVEQAYPNTPQVMYSRALCMARLGRLEEARVLCNKAESMHGDAAARELRAMIDSYKAMTAPTVVLPHYEEPAVPPRTPAWILYMAGAVVVIFAYLGTTALFRGCADTPSAASTSPMPAYQSGAIPNYPPVKADDVTLENGESAPLVPDTEEEGALPVAEAAASADLAPVELSRPEPDSSPMSQNSAER